MRVGIFINGAFKCEGRNDYFKRSILYPLEESPFPEHDYRCHEGCTWYYNSQYSRVKEDDFEIILLEEYNEEA